MPSAHVSFASPRVGAPRVVWPAGALLGEGLCWSPAQQAIYWVDILGQTLMRQDMRSGERRIWSFDETISAVAERADLPGLIVSLRRQIAFFDPDTGALQRLPETEPQWPGNRFNDGKCDALGRFWACTMDFDCAAPTGSLYRVTPGQPLPQIECAWEARFPVVNGPTWSADGGTLWLNDTAGGAVHAMNCDPVTGRVSQPRRWLQLREGEGLPDGMTTDAQGRLWIAHWSGGRVTCHAPDDGRELACIALPASNVTNVALGGPDFTTLFISTAATGLSTAERQAQPMAGALFAVDTDAVGLAAHRFAG